ncbi:hypothetical protein ACHQM5_019656 [Ranunculus cassubicifolius]
MNFIQKRILLLYPSSLIRFICSNSTTHHHNSFTISYLINTCGLSQQKAISASKKLHFESSTKPDSVLTLFRNNEFSNSQISKIIASCPHLLLSNVDKTLKPKFEFFNSKGLFGTDLGKVLFKGAHILDYSLENNIVPSFESLKSIVGSDANVISMLKKSTVVLSVDHERMFAPKLTLLNTHGVCDSNIAKLLVWQPRVFLMKNSRFNEIVAEVKKMEFDPSHYYFLIAIYGLASMSRSSLEAKFNVFRNWGWTEDQLRSAFRKFPYCVALSAENITSTMDHFVNKLGYAPSLIAEQPIVLTYSLERRIIPRCSIIQVLFTNGLLKKTPPLNSFLSYSENAFLKNYITKFEKEVPELMDAYQIKLKLNGLDHCSSIP